MPKNGFSIWINQKFLDWQSSLQERKTLADFAKHLDVPAPTLSTWFSGKRTPNDIVTIRNLAFKLGSDIYNVLPESGKNDYLLQYIIANWDGLSPEKQLQFKAMIDEGEGRETKFENKRTNPHRT